MFLFKVVPEYGYRWIVAINTEQLYVKNNTENKHIMRKRLDKILNKYKILAKLGGMYLTFLELRGEVLE